MKSNSQDNQIQDWRDLLRAAQESECEMRGVEPFVEALEESSDEAMSLRCRRDALLVSAEELTAEMNAAFAMTHDAAMALRSYVKGVLGLRSERLVRFGIKPLRRRRGRACRK
jgi:hypothetical protein